MMGDNARKTKNTVSEMMMIT